ncbi:MAG: hypothetical protein WBN69_04880 [Eudoraea sp.]
MPSPPDEGHHQLLGISPTTIILSKDARLVWSCCARNGHLHNCAQAGHREKTDADLKPCLVVA